MEKEQQEKKPVDHSANTALPSAGEDTQAAVIENSTSSLDSMKVKTNSNADTDLSHFAKKQKKSGEITSISSNNTLQSPDTDHQDISFHGKNTDYCSFSTMDKKSSQSNTEKPPSVQPNPVQHLLSQATVWTSDLESEEDDQKKKIAAAKKLLFPNALATSFSEVVDTLRDERRQEFCPIYKDETPEEIASRQTKRKPVGSLLAKRIRWDDLKRKREDERQAQIPLRYGPYGPVYTNQPQSFPNSYGQYNRNMPNQPRPSFANSYEQYNGNMPNQPQPSFANPYEQYYATMHNQYEQMVQIARAQQEYQGFWPGSNPQSAPENNNQLTQSSIQQQNQPYTYPYPAMYSNNMAGMNTNSPVSYTSTDYNLYLNSLNQPPPPPPNEPYPY